MGIVGVSVADEHGAWFGTQAGQHVLRRRDTDASRQELDAEWQAIHHSAEVGDHVGVVIGWRAAQVLPTGQEQPDGLGCAGVACTRRGKGERSDTDEALARDAEGQPTGDQNRQVGRRVEELRDGRGDVLDVDLGTVQHHQHRSVRREAAKRLFDSHSGRRRNAESADQPPGHPPRGSDDR